ncbi:L-rhamnose-1-dehydrogenase, partial [Saitozyma sp. JCM 24511]
MSASSLLLDKVVVITGASQGIGKACALACARNGADIVLHHLGAATRAEAEAVRQEIEDLGRRCVLVEGDISEVATSDAIVHTAVSSFGRIDSLISNAGIFTPMPFLSTPPEIVSRMISVNLQGPFQLVQAVARQMITQPPNPATGQRGSVVMISSIAAIRGGGDQAHYNATKAGVRSLMESCAIALGPQGVRCNTIMPGSILTPINAHELSTPSQQAARAKRSAIQRIGLPDDVADPVVFLCSDMA